ncbi:MAG TPA: histidine kinase [Solirubrobacteraceae bacterium]|nr:histidine kinase [Solirubrobacteraceae bacterium]
MEQQPVTEQTPAPVSVHFVNNVLAAVASYVDDDPDMARDVLAELSAFLSYRLRTEGLEVPLTQELDHVGVYIRLQQARFPDRVQAVLPPRGEAPDVRVVRSAVQEPVARLLGGRLAEHPGAARLVLRLLPDGTALEAEVAGPGGDGLQRVHIPLEVSPS